MFGIGPLELVVILVVALLVLGPKRMPELARTLGRGIGEFRRASNDLRQSLALDDLQNELRDGLGSANSILNPKPSDKNHGKDNDNDRPAQAGDDLAPGENTEDEATREKAHPGELPLDNAYEHNADPDNADADNTDADNANADSADQDGANEIGDTKTGEATRKTASAADSDLGNVPVGGGPAESDDERG